MRKIISSTVAILLSLSASAEMRHFNEWRAGTVKGSAPVAATVAKNKDSTILAYECGKDRDICAFRLAGQIECKNEAKYSAHFRAGKSMLDDVNIVCLSGGGYAFLGFLQSKALNEFMESADHFIVSIPEISLTLVFSMKGYSEAIAYMDGLSANLNKISDIDAGEDKASVQPRKELSETCIKMAELIREEKELYDRQFNEGKLRREQQQAFLAGTGGKRGFGNVMEGGRRASEEVEIKQQAAMREAMDRLMDMQFKYDEHCRS